MSITQHPQAIDSQYQMPLPIFVKRGRGGILSFVILILTFLFILPGISGAQEKGPPKDCSALNKEEVLTILKNNNAPPETAILSLQPSPLQGLCEVAIRVNLGRVVVFYMDPSKQFMFWGNLVDLNTRENKTAAAVSRVRESIRLDVSKISLQDTLILGEAGAAKKVIVFTDPDCPFCKVLHQTLKQVVKKRKDIAVHIKLFPLPIHPEAYGKSKSIICKKSLQMLEDNFDNKQIPKAECASTEVDDDMKLAATIGIDGTPTMVLPNGSIFSGGAITEEELIWRIDGKP